MNLILLSSENGERESIEKKNGIRNEMKDMNFSFNIEKWKTNSNRSEEGKLTQIQKFQRLQVLESIQWNLLNRVSIQI